MLGFAAGAAVWLAAARHPGSLADAPSPTATSARRRTGSGRSAIVAASTLGRVWLVALAVLLVGLLGEREAGLAAAVLVLVLVTVSIAASGLTQLLFDEELAKRARHEHEGEGLHRRSALYLAIAILLLS